MTQDKKDIVNIDSQPPVHHHHHRRHHHRLSKVTVTTWVILAVLCVVFFLIATNFVIFPKKFKLPLLLILAVIAVLMAFFSFHKFLKRGRTITAIINIILSAALLVGCVYLPHLEGQLKGVFKEQGETTEVKINVYAFTQDYKNEHSEVLQNAQHLDTPTDISAYANSSFLTQTSVDQDNQSKAIDAIAKAAGSSSLWTIDKTTIWDEISAFYNGEGELLILNEAYVPTIEEQDSYKNFSSDTKVIYTYTGEEQTQADTVASDSLINAPFLLYIAGSDSRDTALTSVTRTDVNILLAVDPVNRNVLEVGIPRDAYIGNPAYNGALDKLTHLGVMGIDNTLKGVSSCFGQDINNYMLVNFNTYSTIINALDGIDIDNPYEFTTVGGNGGGDYTFPQGTIHLDGDQALSYVRERYNLPAGDMGRNEHQLIVIQGIINKMTSADVLTHYNQLLTALQDKFLTNIDTDDIYGLVQKQVNDGGSWNVVKYHLLERGDMQETASAPGQALYVGWLYDNQVQFVEEQMTAVMNGQQITQQELPAGE